MKDRIGKEVLGEITVFERDGRIGGRESSFGGCSSATRAES